MGKFLRWINSSLIFCVKSVPSCKFCMQSGHQNPVRSSQSLMNAEGIEATLHADGCLQPTSLQEFSPTLKSSENIELFALHVCRENISEGIKGALSLFSIP